MSKGVIDLISILDLEPIEVNLFRGNSPEDELAAGVRRPGDRPGDGGGVPHRRRAGCRTRCIAISSCRATRRFRSSTRSNACATARASSTRRVTAIQHGNAIFSIMVSFHAEEEGAFDHQEKMPDVPPPEKLTAEEVAKQPMFKEMPDFIRR